MIYFVDNPGRNKEGDVKKRVLKKVFRCLLGFIVVFAVAVMPVSLSAQSVSDPKAAQIGTAIGYAMSGEDGSARGQAAVDVRAIRPVLDGVIESKDFFLGGVIITEFEPQERGGFVTGVTIHRDNTGRGIMTGFRTRYQERAGGFELVAIDVREIINPNPRMTFLIIPADKISPNDMRQNSFAEALAYMNEKARVVEAKQRPDKEPRDYVVCVVFMDRGTPGGPVRIVMSDTPGAVNGAVGGDVFDYNGWTVVATQARFAYDAGPERFFNIVVGNAGRNPRVVGVYSTHSFIRRVQRALTEKGYDPGPVDGRIGGKTRSAIQAFQRDCSIYLDGVPTPSILRLLKTPDLSSVIELVQKSLVAIGYDVGTVDGVMGPQTKKAINDFKRDHLIQTKGVLTADVVCMIADEPFLLSAGSSSGGPGSGGVSPFAEPAAMERFEGRMWPNQSDKGGSR